MAGRLFVVTSCTASKRWDVADGLTAADFCDPARLAQREAQLAPYRCSAEQMYTGLQHRYLLEGLELFRRPGVAAQVGIVSAGYGLIAGNRPIVPYNVSFSDMRGAEVRAWAQRLGIPAALRAAIDGYPLVIFLLGQRYLTAIEPPVYAGSDQRLVFLTRPGETRVQAPGVVVVDAGRRQCRRFRCGLVALKGAMFRGLAAAIATDPAYWLPAICADESPATIVRALGAGAPLEGGQGVQP